MSTLPAAGARGLDESTLKSLLRDQPGAANLHFALALQYVAQGRWPDAQLAFFDAVRNEPANADYAYNLAVSLDHLGQSAPAAAYYQRALELASASSLFDAGAAADRLAALQPAGP
jgi:Tfp pilus assembly protein PilF